MSPLAVVAVSAAWAGAALLVLAAVAIAILAIRLRQPLLAVFAFLPVGAGILVLVFAGAPTLPVPAVLPALTGLGLAALGVVAGNPLTVWVLRRASGGGSDGAHGGILVPDAGGARDATRTREVLRGGTWIGYLERLAIVGAIAVGRFEIVAAVIAIKGLGRFSELDSPEARERFIIGTLVSMTWAAVCGALIVLGIVPALSR